MTPYDTFIVDGKSGPGLEIGGAKYWVQVTRWNFCPPSSIFTRSGEHSTRLEALLHSWGRMLPGHHFVFRILDRTCSTPHIRAIQNPRSWTLVHEPRQE